jgi:uncharacterized membrane protein
MAKTAKEFVANDLWMAIAVLTLGCIVFFGALGLEIASSVVVAIGWFMLTPLFLFWGDEIAEFLYGGDESGTPSEESDALTELKQRYARGEIDDAEFERRLERLIELDEVPSETRRVTEMGHRNASELDSDIAESQEEGEQIRNRDLES